MRSLLALLLVVTAATGRAEEPEVPPETALRNAAAVEPVMRSLAAVGGGAVAFTSTMVAAALLGAVAAPFLAPLAPAFFPPSTRTGVPGLLTSAATGGMVLAAIVAPVAVLFGIVVDAVAWAALMRPVKARPVVVLGLAELLAVVLTVPTLAVTCVMMMLVAVASRQQQDRLAAHPDRAFVVAALGWGLPIVFLTGPIALSAAIFRGVVHGTLAGE